jgi:hypothetical protein
MNRWVFQPSHPGLTRLGPSQVTVFGVAKNQKIKVGLGQLGLGQSHQYELGLGQLGLVLYFSDALWEVRKKCNQS